MDYIPLDLREHDPEDFYGKSVTWQNVEFVIGRHIATGAESIVHRLINRFSGEYGFVVKIDRGLPSKGGIPQPIDGEFHLLHELILTSADITLPGGKAHIQPLVDTGHIGHPDKVAKMKEAHALFAEKRLAESIAIYRELTFDFPDDLEVRYNFGAVLAQDGHIDEAFEVFAGIVHDDIFDLQSRVAAIRCAAGIGPRDLLEMVLLDTVRLFPMAQAPRQLAIEVFLDFGLPDIAVRFVAAHYELFKNHYGDIIQSFDHKLSAQKQLCKIRQNFIDPTWFRAIKAQDIEPALKTYDRDPLIIINKALALRRAQRFAEGAELLLDCIRKLLHRDGHHCLVNAAFCYATDGQVQKADSLLDVALKNYRRSYGEGELDVCDFGLVANWVEKDEESGIMLWLEDFPAAVLDILEGMGPPPAGSAREVLTPLYAAAKTDGGGRPGFRV